MTKLDQPPKGRVGLLTLASDFHSAVEAWTIVPSQDNHHWVQDTHKLIREWMNN